MYDTFDDVFLFFFFLERENREIFIYFRRIHRFRVGGEAMKFENRWTRNDGHIYDLCVSLGGRIGRASYCTDRPLGCLLYTLVHRVLPVTRTYLRGISRRRVNKLERVSNY